jgi:ubiquitin-conjugating enzyme E2 O
LSKTTQQRCWHDAEDISPHPAAAADPLMRALQPGEVGVSFLTNGGEREILPEADLKLVDRTVQPGDFCKRAIDEVQSGVITDVRIKSRIEHVISGEVVEGWKTVEDIDRRVDAEIGDYVVFDDWIGQVCCFGCFAREKLTTSVAGYRGVKYPKSLLQQGFSLSCQLYDESLVEVSNGQLVRLPEISSRLCVGDKGNVSEIISFFFGH